MSNASPLSSATLNLWAQLTEPSRGEVKAAYRALLLTPPEERARWLDEGEFTSTSREILYKLARSEGFEFGDIPQRIGKLLAPPAASKGDQFGTWEVIQPIGRGGMGEVFLVKRRSQGTEQIAAMKLLSTLCTSSIEKELFRRENEYLARLGRLIDSGATDGGAEFIVMGLASEGSITSYCDQRQLGLRRRLSLFAELCEEVEHLHNIGIIHCDIKPDNVLVAADGNVHLIDFGIARLEKNDTRPAPRSYTPRYAAPEQRLPTPTYSRRTDTFSLGKVLEDLLIGDLSKKTDVATRRSLRNQLASHPDLARELAIARNTTVKALSADFHENIDQILAQAQNQDPAERYQNTRDLYSAVMQYTASLPNPHLPSLVFWKRAWRTQAWRIGALGIAIFASGVAVGWLSAQ